MQYPVKCKIIDVTGEEIFPGIFGRTPEISKPHIGKLGVAEREVLGVRIRLDDGNVLMGYECWWEPIDTELVATVNNEGGAMTKYVWVLILDYQAEPDWSVEGIFETEELAEKYRLYCEERDRNRLRIEKVALNRLRYMEGPEEEWMKGMREEQ